MGERNIMGELGMCRQLGIKPNFSGIARRYDLDRHMVAGCWREGDDVDDERRRRGSGFDCHRSVIEAKTVLPGATKKAVREYLLHRAGDPDLLGYNALTHSMSHPRHGVAILSWTRK